jgi:hypothetical protein
MRAFALVAALALPACIEDHYQCTTDSDCNLGAGGRCERDHLCTAHDDTCPLQRRYTAHSGAVAGQCFAESAVPLDPCASGQPPAPIASTDACTSSVCSAVPSCCATAWSDPCVQAAQVLCDLRCDTRIAITAEQNLEPTASATAFALLDLRITKSGMTYTRVDPAHSAFLDWLAPAHGESEPRLASLDATREHAVIIAGTLATMFPVGADRSYDSLQSVDFDRDGRDKAAFASFGSSDRFPIDVLDLETGVEREIEVPGHTPLAAFGDWDGDAFPDIATGTSGFGGGYQLLHNIDAPDTHARDLEVAWASGASAATTGNAPLQAFAWADLDGDGVIDLIQFGSSVRIHFGADTRAPNSPRLQIDCDPLAINPPSPCVGTDVEVIGTPVFTSSGTQLAVSIDNATRNIYPVTFDRKSAALRSALLMTTCGPGGCPPLRAIVARDLDGDHALDLVAIDATLTVYIHLAIGTNLTIPAPAGLPASSFKLVRASVTGAVQ